MNYTVSIRWKRGVQAVQLTGRRLLHKQICNFEIVMSTLKKQTT
jgi:hypothetical protein